MEKLKQAVRRAAGRWMEKRKATEKHEQEEVTKTDRIADTRQTAEFADSGKKSGMFGLSESSCHCREIGLFAISLCCMLHGGYSCMPYPRGQPQSFWTNMDFRVEDVRAENGSVPQRTRSGMFRPRSVRRGRQPV